MQAFLPWPAATDCGYEQTRYPDGPQKEPRVQTVAVNAPLALHPIRKNKRNQQQWYVNVCLSVYIYIHVRIYIYTHRERERD